MSVIASGTTTTTALVYTADTSGVLQLQTNGTTTAVTIDTAQNVGVGVTPSSWSGVKAIEVYGLGSALVSGGNNDIELVSNAYYNGSWKYAATGAAAHYYQSSGVHYWRIANSGSTGGTVSFTQAMTLDNSGNLLVGTTNTNPVASAATGIVALSSGGIRISNTGSGSYMGITTSSGTQLSFYTYSSGAVLAGAITNPTSNTTAYTSISDYRLKENITPMSGALSVVNQLKPCTYDWISDKSKGQGFIAHELQALVPDCVIGEKDAVDKEGNPKYQSVDTSFLIATLTSAIQELSAKVTALEAKVA